MRPHRGQPTRLPLPWDSSGKNTGVGCHFLLQCMKVKSESEVAQLCPTLCDPMDCSLPGSSVCGIFQARVLEWGAIAFSDVNVQWEVKEHHPYWPWLLQGLWDFSLGETLVTENPHGGSAWRGLSTQSGAERAGRGVSVLTSPLRLLSLYQGKGDGKGWHKSSLIRAVYHWLEKSRANWEFFPAVKGLSIKEKMRTLNMLSEVGWARHKETNSMSSHVYEVF